jgi:hypothetical protein
MEEDQAWSGGIEDLGQPGLALAGKWRAGEDVGDAGGRGVGPVRAPTVGLELRSTPGTSTPTATSIGVYHCW